MFNSLTTPLDYLASRRSGKARNMVAPGPDDGQLRAILDLAMRTPDHGKLAPWRFIVIDQESRERLGTTLKSAWIAEHPGTDVRDLGALDQFACQAPTLVILVSSPNSASKIPVWEQELSAGAVGMNLLHAAHATGFVGSWLTGWAAYSRNVTTALGLSDDERIAGYFFFGTNSMPLDERPRPAHQERVTHW
jgi:nitroreductase